MIMRVFGRLHSPMPHARTPRLLELLNNDACSPPPSRRRDRVLRAAGTRLPRRVMSTALVATRRYFNIGRFGAFTSFLAA